MHSDAPSPATREMSQRASAPIGRTLSMSLNGFGGSEFPALGFRLCLLKHRGPLGPGAKLFFKRYSFMQYPKKSQ